MFVAVIGRAVTRHDLSRQLSRTGSQAFLGDVDYPTYWASIVVAKIVESGCFFFSRRTPSAGSGFFGSLGLPHLNRQVHWLSTGCANRLAD